MTIPGDLLGLWKRKCSGWNSPDSKALLQSSRWSSVIHLFPASGHGKELWQKSTAGGGPLLSSCMSQKSILQSHSSFISTTWLWEGVQKVADGPPNCLSDLTATVSSEKIHNIFLTITLSEKTWLIPYGGCLLRKSYGPHTHPYPHTKQIFKVVQMEIRLPTQWSWTPFNYFCLSSPLGQDAPEYSSRFWFQTPDSCQPTLEAKGKME